MANTDDILFFESNPAASALLNKTEIAFFHRNLISDVNLDSLFFTQRLGQFGYGFGAKFLHFEFTALDNLGGQIASATPAEVLFIANASYNFFRNYNFAGISLGIHVKFVHRSVPPELYSHVLSPEVSNQSISGIMGDIGLLSRFNFLKPYPSREKNFSLGLSALNVGPAVKNTSPPTDLRLGFSWKPLAFMTISSDINVLINLVDVEQSEGFGFSSGLHLNFVDFFAIRSGFELRGGNPRISIGANIDLEPVNFFITYILDLGTSFSSFDNFSVGAALNFGDEGRSLITEEVDRLYIDALLAFSERNYQKAIALCRRIVDPQTGLDPAFTPAQEMLQTALASFEQEEFFRNFRSNREYSDPVTEPE